MKNALNGLMGSLSGMKEKHETDAAIQKMELAEWNSNEELRCDYTHIAASHDRIIPLQMQLCENPHRLTIGQ